MHTHQILLILKIDSIRKVVEVMRQKALQMQEILRA